MIWQDGTYIACPAHAVAIQQFGRGMTRAKRCRQTKWFMHEVVREILINLYAQDRNKIDAPGV